MYAFSKKNCQEQLGKIFRLLVIRIQKKLVKIVFMIK